MRYSDILTHSLFQYRDDDLPPLDYGLNHTLIVKALNNTYGDLPFMTHSDEVSRQTIQLSLMLLTWFLTLGSI